MVAPLTLFPMGSRKQTTIPTERLRTKPTKPRFTAEDVRKIYEAYPRHKAPGTAYKAIETALGRIDDEDPVGSLLAIVKEFADSPAGQKEKRFIPYPATWFNAKSYLEDPQEWED